MPEKEHEIASDTVKNQLGKLTLELASYKKANDTLTEENKLLKKQNLEMASVIENDLKADLKLKIMAASDYKEVDLEKLSIDQLNQIEQTLSKSKGWDAVAVTQGYKSIRAGSVAGDTDLRLTTGNLYGKSRQQILEMEGTF